MKLLLVDDESFVRERIRLQINWQEIGIDQLEVCDDGERALNVIRVFKPDILVTDIRMPGLDGIKLAEEYLYHNPEAKVIFISGYSDVPYLRSAIRLRAVSYVEKPIDIAELTADIRTAAEEITNRYQVSLDREELRAKSLFARQTSIAKSLINEENHPEAVQALKEYFKEKSFCLFAAGITQLFPSDRGGLGSPEELFSALMPAFGNAGIGMCFFQDENRLVFHILCTDETQKKTAVLAPLFEQITDYLAQRQVICCHVIGRFVRDASQLYRSYQSAMQSLLRYYYREPGCLILSQEEKPRSLDLNEIPLSAYSHALQKENSEMIVSMLNNLAAQLKMNDGTLPSDVHRFYYSIIMRMYREAEKENILLFDLPMDEYRMLDRLRSCRFLDELHQYTLSVIRDYYEKVNNHYTDNPVVNKIIGYIQQNYANPELSIGLISEHMHLSSSYLAHLFRNVTGCTLGDYLTRIRIDKAQEIMESGEYRVKDVARMVGYRNGNYFSYAFKKQKGFAPSGRAEDLK